MGMRKIKVFDLNRDELPNGIGNVGKVPVTKENLERIFNQVQDAGYEFLSWVVLHGEAFIICKELNQSEENTE